MSYKNNHETKVNYTYKDLRVTKNRDDMKDLPFMFLGTQSGGFGKFNYEFKLISKKGEQEIIDQLTLFFAKNEITPEMFAIELPSLVKLFLDSKQD